MKDYTVEINLRDRESGEVISTSSIGLHKAMVNGLITDVDVFNKMVAEQVKLALAKES